MNELRDLYQEVILDHSRCPRNFGKLDCANCQAEGHNPLCGDQCQVFLKLDDAHEKVDDVSFEGVGCAICTASASIMTEALKGKTLKEAKTLFERFHRLVKGERLEDDPDLGKLEVFANVSEFPVRVKCASLAWHTVKAALDGTDDETVTTE